MRNLAEQKSEPGEKNRAVIFLGIVLFQLLSTLLCFQSPGELFKTSPIINIDWSPYYYLCYSARRFLEESGRIWGFDPYYMAGYPLDFVYNPSLPVQLATITFRALEIGLVIKWFFFLSFLVAPIIFYSALRNFGLEKNSALWGTALGICYFWLGEEGLFGNFGMLTGALMLNFFLLALGVGFKYFQNPGKRNWLELVLVVSVSLLIHKTSVALVGIPFIILLVIFRRSLNKKVWLGLLLAGGLAIVFNSFWLVPFFKFLPYKIEDPLTTFFQNTDPLRFIKDIIPWGGFWGTNLARLIIVLFGVYGLVCLRRVKEKRELFWFCSLGLLFFFLLVYFGSFLSWLRHIQPYRHLTGWYFFWLIGAGIGLERIRGRLSERSLRLSQGAVLGFLLFLILLQFSPSYRLLYAVSPLSGRFPGRVLELMKWLEENTDLSARIMIEDINRWEGKEVPYGASRFVGLLPAYLPRYLVGGPHPNAFIQHHFVSFHDGYFLKKPIQSYSEQELKEYFQLYNIKWAVAWSKQSKEKLSELSFSRKRAQFQGLDVFEFALEPSWFLRGTGKVVKMDYEQIHLSGLKPEKGMVVLKVHFLKGFHSFPPVRLFCYQRFPDPVGFLALENPPEEVVLKYGR